VSIDAMEASGPSVWAFATRWEEKQRRGVWMRSEDGGATWTQPALPRGMNDVTHVYRESPTTAYVATAGFNAGGVFWRTTDGGTTWTRVPTPKDQGVHEIPSHGTRIEHIATVGDRLVVREYGMVFVTRADSIRWRRLDDVEYVTADRKRGELFVLTDKLEAAMLDRELRMVWRTSDRIPSSRSRDVEEVVAHAGTGWVTMSQGEIYEARDGRLRVVRPGGDRAR
jgi:hypothetical protein